MNLPPDGGEHNVHVYSPEDVLLMMLLAQQGQLWHEATERRRREFEFDPVASLGEALLVHFTPPAELPDSSRIRRIVAHPFIPRSLIGGYLRSAVDIADGKEATTDVSEGKLPVPNAEIVFMGRSAAGPFRLAIGAIPVKSDTKAAERWVVQALAIDNDVRAYAQPDQERTQRGWELLLQNADPTLATRLSRLTIGELVATEQGSVFTPKNGLQLNETVLGADWRAMLGVVTASDGRHYLPVSIVDGKVGTHSSYENVDWDQL